MNKWFEERHAPEAGIYLCLTTEIAVRHIKEFRFGKDSPFSFRMFIYNDEGEFKAFKNACPHFNVPLNHTPEDVFTPDRKHFICMTHYAKFETGSGLCIEGPCTGEALERIPLQQDGERLLIGECV